MRYAGSMPDTPDASVDTASVTGCRELRFETVEEAIRDAERLVGAERAGRLRRLGNWTLGQALGHVAAWASYPYEGYPITPPWIVRVLGPLMKKRVLRGPLPRGYRLPGVAGGTYATEAIDAQVALDRYRGALRRLATTPPTAPNPVLGHMTPDEWLRLHLGHAALHQGFFIPE